MICLSCGSRRRLEGADGGEDLPKDVARQGHLSQLEDDLAGMAHNPRPDLDQAALDAGERPIGDVFGQISMAKEAAEIVCQRMKLKPDLVVAEPLAGEQRPVDRVFTFLDVLLSCATLIVEADDPLRLHRQVGDDKAHAGEQVAGVPFHLGNDPAGFAPGSCLILKVMVEAPHIIGWATHWALQEMRDSLLKHSVALQTDGVEVAFCFQHLVQLWDRRSSVGSEKAHQVAGLVAGDDGSQNLFPAIGAVNIALTRDLFGAD